MRFGIIVKEFDIIVRDVIVEYGYGDYFIYLIGYGVGFEIYEWLGIN